MGTPKKNGIVDKKCPKNKIQIPKISGRKVTMI